MMKLKIFLTGSTSYVGTKFIELFGSKFDIYGVARSDQDHPINLLDENKLAECFHSFQPDFVVHLAADVGRDAVTSNEIVKTNPTITKHLIDLASQKQIPFIFTSTEAVYGGKEDIGGYVETDAYKPRSPYGASKVESEKIVMGSGLPYLITRGHRHVGINKHFDRPKQFPDTLHALEMGNEVHLDANKIFNPVLINNVCDIIVHYIKQDSEKQVLINIGVDERLTYYKFVRDVAKILGFAPGLLRDDGDEAGWPSNSSLSINKLHELGYPYVNIEQLLEVMKADYQK